AATGLSIMCFVANRGIVQIHTGAVKKLLRTGPWFNVLDDTFNLHLNTEAVASSWVVNKPTVDGWVTSLELYGEDGGMIVQFFGERKPGQPELPEWRHLLESLCPQALAA
ncbi:MAG TPA: hemin-degrading factor, partial [Cupriavidus sp.]|nr:hemin-degrading factor [Cupriavidus sp.]